MMEYLKIAFRNLSRYKKRSILTGLGMLLGSFLLIFSFAYGNGIEEQLISNMVQSTTGHLRITAHKESSGSDFEEAFQVEKNLIDNAEQIREELTKHSGIRDVKKQINITGILSNGYKMKPGMIIGVEPEKEVELLHRILPATQGEPLSKEDRGAIYIGPVVAATYEVGIGDLLTVMAETQDGVTNVGDFVVKGIFRSGSPQTEMNSYIPLFDADALAQLGGKVNLLKVMLEDAQSAEAVATMLHQEMGTELGIEIKDWKSAGGFFFGTIIATQVFNIVFCAILFIIVTITVMNTMLIAVYARTREIGTLMAIGTKRRQIIFLFITEAFLLGFLATGLGIILGSGLVFWLQKVGIPAFLESMRYAYGGDRVYPFLKGSDLLATYLSVVLLTVISSIYPAYTGSKLKPVEALAQV
ncbi:MAG TPA: hypothetical protein DDZ91_12500 [Firmicutes bacterium]|nr:hypothetical protein [Bacillota bacterium]